MMKPPTKSYRLLSAAVLMRVFYFAAFLNYTTSGHRQESLHEQDLRICTVSAGVDIARYVSTNLQTLFRGALEDVEFIREYVSEAATNQGISGGLHNLEAMSHTLQWASRNLTSSDTTLTAGLGYVDDRSDRRIERYVSLVNEPFVGTKESDIALIDTVSNILPWIVDRRSDVSEWWLPHQNGQSSTRAGNQLSRLYTAAWIGTPGEAWMYYPPASLKFGPLLGRTAVTAGDNLGPAYNSREEEFIKPNLPDNNPHRTAHFSPPYPDTADAGLSLITAQAPVYFTGTFRGIAYDDTYIASTGVDISVASMSGLLDQLVGSLTKGSFAFLVDRETFGMIMIPESTLHKIYPERTGFEESRVTRSTADGSIIRDRRNQTYLVSDTIFQSPLQLANADWRSLAAEVKSLEPGLRSWMEINITLTGESQATNFYAMYENWATVANWTLVVFAPVEEVDNAATVAVDNITIYLEVMEGKTVRASSVIMNKGSLDLTLSLAKLPPWLQLLTDLEDKQTLPAGHNLTLEYETIGHIPDRGTSLVAISVSDDGYPECVFDEVIAIPVEIKVLHEHDFNHLGPIRFYGHALATIVLLTSVGWSVWVFRNKEHRVVRASQPIFLYMMCGGIFLMGASIIPLGIDDGVASERGCSIACMSIAWLLTMGFSITFAALFSKIWRINQIVQACRSYRRVDVSIRHVMVPFVVIFSLNATILSLWTALDPKHWKRESLAESSSGAEDANEFSSVGYCAMGTTPLAFLFLALILLINFFALVLALVQLYKARELSTEYSEGKYIAIAIGSMLQAFLTGLPVLVIARNTPKAFFIVNSTIVFVISMSLLLLMFLPKFYIASSEESTKFPASAGDLGLQRRVSNLENQVSTSGVQNQVAVSNSPLHSSRLESGRCEEEKHRSSTTSESLPEEGELVSYISEISLFTISEHEVGLDEKQPSKVQSAFALHDSTSLDGIPKLPSRAFSLAEEEADDTGEHGEAQEGQDCASIDETERPKLRNAFSFHGGSPRDDCPKPPPREYSGDFELC